MLLFKLFHFISGSVNFVAKNGFSERFINLCTAAGIPLWNMRKCSNRLYASTSISGYKKIREPAKKSGMKVHQLKKFGLPFFLFRHRDRAGVLIGFAIMFAALIVLSGNIWVIEVHGNTVTSDSQIEQAFEDAGLTLGCRTGNLKLQQIKAKALVELKTLTWASVNIRGCTAVIEVREAKQSPDIEETAGTSNVVAVKDGQVEIIEPYRGTAAVKPGQTVLKGELLVSGVTKSRTESYLFSDAKGYIVARTTIDVDSETKAKRKVLIADDRKVYSICILGKEFKLGNDRQATQIYSHKAWMYIGKKRMPFGIFYTLYTNFDEKEEAMDKVQTKLTAINDYSLKCYRETNHAQIITSEQNISQSADGVEIKGKYSCFENIGKRIPFEIEEIPEATSLADKQAQN